MPGVIVTILLVAVLLFLIWRVRFGYPPPGSVQVLCFHKVTPEFCFEGTWMRPRTFAALLDDLMSRGYRFVDETEYLASLDAPDSGGARRVWLTFDDAYENVYRYAFPELKQRGIAFHLFVVSAFIGKDNTWELSLGRRPHRHADRDALLDMMAHGATIGSHGATHRDLTRLDDETLRAELNASRAHIADELGVTPRTVSYPFGRCDRRVMAAAEASGYDAGFSLYPRHANGRQERFALRRCGVYIIDPPRSVWRKLRPNGWFWLEEMKCRAINAVAVLTPLLKHRSNRRERPGS